MTGSGLPYFAQPPSAADPSLVSGWMTLQVLAGVLPELRPQHALEWQAIRHNTFNEWGRGGKMSEYRARVELALWFLEQAYIQAPEAVSRLVVRTLADHHHAHKLSFFSAVDAKAKETHEREEVALRSQLEHYTDLYENFWRLLISPITFSKDVNASHDDAGLAPNRYVALDARKKFDKLNFALIVGGSPMNILVHGCEPRLRNGIAHRRYRFLDAGVEVWDESPGRGVHWKRTYTLAELKQFNSDIASTIGALETALGVFVMRHRAEMNAKGWDDALKGEPVTLEQQQSALFVVAREMFFELASAALNEATDELHIELKVPLRLNPQGLGQVIAGGSGAPQVLHIRWRLTETPLKTQVIGLLQRVAGIIDGHKQYRVSVVAHDGRPLGHLVFAGERLADIQKGELEVELVELLEDALDPEFKIEVSIPEEVE